MQQPKTLTELKSLRKPVRNIREEQQKRFSWLDRVALAVTERIGTMGFFLVLLFWAIVWLGWNIWGPPDFRFDPYPAFVLWLFISNLIQLLLMPLIMLGQNLHGRYAEARSEADFDMNVKAEREIETILQHLENQDELMRKVLDRLEDKK